MIQFIKVNKPPPKRRFVEVSSDDVFWQALHRASDKHYPLLRRIFLDAWGNWRDNIDINALYVALVARDTTRATSVAIQPWMTMANALYTELMPVLTQTFTAGAEASLPVVNAAISESIGAEIGIRFGGPASIQVQTYIRRYVGDLITQIGETERQAIRRAILDGVTNGRTPAQVARDIQQFIGITDRQSQTLIRLRQTMEEAGIRADKIEQAIERRTRKMLRYRAKTISLNESLTASKAGQKEIWMEGVQQGWIDLNTARRFWVITPLDACETCLPVPGMNPDGRRLDEPFETPIGPLMTAHAHVICRCVERLEL